MPHGAPDWSNVVKYYQVHRLDDMAELAARLGSVVQYDRRGDVFFMDSFENGKGKWFVASDGVGGQFIIDHEYAALNGFSGKLIPPGSDQNWTGIRHIEPLVQSNTVGFSFRYGAWEGAQYHLIEIRVEDEEEDREYKVRIDPLTVGPDRYQYLNEVGNWTTFGGTERVITWRAGFNYVKLVIDWRKKEYLRFLSNDKEYSLQGIAGYLRSSVTENRRFLFWYRVYGTDLGTEPGWIDCAVATMNEP